MCRSAIMCCALSVAAGWPMAAAGQGPPAPAYEPAVGKPAAGAAGLPTSPTAERLDRDATSLLQRLDLSGFWNGNGVLDWGVLAVAVLVGLVVGRIVAGVLRRLSRRAEGRGWNVQAAALADLAGPASLALLTAGLLVGLANLKMNAGLRDFLGRTLLLMFVVAAVWYAYSLIGALELLLRRRADSTLKDQVTPLVRKGLRGLLVVLAALFVIDAVFDRDIGAWLAGLGIAGLGVSLAAQDSLKNLFGSITLLLDRPFGVGDRIVYSGHDGVVVEIGLRSTKLRTLAGNLVTVPNSLIVNEAVENVGRRPTLQRIVDLGVTYGTPPEKVRQAVELLRGLLESDDFAGPIHPMVDGQVKGPRVYFTDFKPDNLNIRILYWYAPPENWWDYMDHAQRLNLRIMEEFTKAEIEFAFPTSTVLLEDARGERPERESSPARGLGDADKE